MQELNAVFYCVSENFSEKYLGSPVLIELYDTAQWLDNLVRERNGIEFVIFIIEDVKRVAVFVAVVKILAEFLDVNLAARNVIYRC